MLLSDPATKKAARAKVETWRQEILDIFPTLFDEGAAEDHSGWPAATHSFRRRRGFPEPVLEVASIADPGDLRRGGLPGRGENIARGCPALDVLGALNPQVHPSRIDGL